MNEEASTLHRRCEGTPDSEVRQVNRPLGQYARIAAFAMGLGFAGWLIRTAGTAEVVGVLGSAWPWISVIALLEVLFAGVDIACLRALLGSSARRIPAWSWIRSAGIAYSVGVLLPAGRATGEVARSSTLSRETGPLRAARACARLQACSLLGIAVASLASGAAACSIRGSSSPLCLGLLVNALLCGGAGVVLLLVLRSSRLGAWLRRWTARLRPGHDIAGESEGTVERAPVLRVAILCGAARFVQLVEYGVALHAVGGRARPATCMVVEGVHLLAATVGDAIPNQMGAGEGAFRAFAAEVGLGAAPARALSIALLVRLAQLLLAMVCMFLALVSRPKSTRVPAQRGSLRAATIGKIEAVRSTDASFGRPLLNSD